MKESEGEHNIVYNYNTAQNSLTLK
jgi:hypothetical protein